MNQGSDSKELLKDIVQGHLKNVASSLFIQKSLIIIDESADNKESYMDAAILVSKRIVMFIDKGLAQKVYDSLIDAVDKSNVPAGTRRRYRRVKCFLDRVRVEYDGKNYELDLLNLSEGGLFIRMQNPFPVGAETVITLTLELRHQVQLRGVVIYNRKPSGETSRLPNGMGIEFKGLSAEVSEKLRSHIRKVPVDRIGQGQ